MTFFYTCQPDALLVPSRGRVFAQVVSSPELHAFSKPYCNIPEEYGKLKLPPAIVSCPGTIILHDLQMSQLSQQSFTPVSQPIIAFEFDWSGRTIPLERNEVNHIPFIPTTNKSTDSNKISETIFSSNNKRSNTAEEVFCHAVLMWWDLTMDQTGNVMLTCAPHWEQPGSQGPDTVPWRDHWMQAIYHLPQPVAIPEGGVPLRLTAARDEYSMWFSLASDLK